MVKGDNPPFVIRRFMYCLFYYGISPREIRMDMALVAHVEANLEYLEDICNMFGDDDRHDETAQYLTGMKSSDLNVDRSSFISEIDDLDMSKLVSLLNRRKSIILQRLTVNFLEEFCGRMISEADFFIARTVDCPLRAAILRNNIRSWHLIDRHHVEQMDFMDWMGYVQAYQIIDIGHMAQSSAEFYGMNGWTFRGDQNAINQIVIGAVAYPVVAAYSDRGFLAWKLYEKNSLGNEIIHFLRDVLRPKVPNCSFAMTDHNVHEAGLILALNETFNGRHFQCISHSAELRPVVRGFANIKDWIREQEGESDKNPLELIEAAFELHCTTGARGHLANAHFEMYRINNSERRDRALLLG